MDRDQLWALVQSWYEIAADEMIGDNTRHTYRECANQLDDLLGAAVGPLDEYRGQ
jgi:hypothetical protein